MPCCSPGSVWHRVRSRGIPTSGQQTPYSRQDQRARNKQVLLLHASTEYLATDDDNDDGDDVDDDENEDNDDETI